VFVCLFIYNNLNLVQWNEEHDITPPSSLSLGSEQVDDDAEMLAQYQQKLQEYKNTFGEHSMDGGAGGGRLFGDEDGYFQSARRSSTTGSSSNSEDGNYELVKNHGYEGDLHATLGALYLSTNDDDIVAASSHLIQAIRLYELSGDTTDTPMADVKLNMALLYLRLGEFISSADAYDDALDIYQQIYGDGINPLSLSSKMKVALQAFAAGNGGLFGVDGDDDDLMMFDFSSFGKLFLGDNDIENDDTNAINDVIRDDESNVVTSAAATTVTAGTDGDANSIVEEDSIVTSSSSRSGSMSSDTARHGNDNNNNYNNEDYRTKKKQQSNTVLLPGGTSIDVQRFLQQNDSIREEL
jgi:tetratricopeptide (TPR) repeat protein